MNLIIIAWEKHIWYVVCWKKEIMIITYTKFIRINDQQKCLNSIELKNKFLKEWGGHNGLCKNTWKNQGVFCRPQAQWAMMMMIYLHSWKDTISTI